MVWREGLVSPRGSLPRPTQGPTTPAACVATFAAFTAWPLGLALPSSESDFLHDSLFLRPYQALPPCPHAADPHAACPRAGRVGRVPQPQPGAASLRCSWALMSFPAPICGAFFSLSPAPGLQPRHHGATLLHSARPARSARLTWPSNVRFHHLATSDPHYLPLSPASPRPGPWAGRAEPARALGPELGLGQAGFVVVFWVCRPAA